ncbi:hypothetical protein ACTHUL_11420, partial [Neisseria sp. P0024.S002]
YNYRKGLDVHDGWDGVITDNQVFNNRFHGIAVEHRGFPGKNCIITNNDITFDSNFRLDRDDDVPDGRELNLKQDYYRQCGIRVELKPQQEQPWGNEVPDPVYLIEGNRVYGINHDERGEHRVIEIYDGVIIEDVPIYMVSNLIDYLNRHNVRIYFNYEYESMVFSEFKETDTVGVYDVVDKPSGNKEHKIFLYSTHILDIDELRNSVKDITIPNTNK